MSLLFTDFPYVIFNTARIFSSVFEIILAYILAYSFFSYSLSKKRWDFLPFVALAGVMIFLQENGVIKQAFLKYLIEFAAFMLILLFVYAAELKQKLIGGMAFALVVSVSVIAASLIFSLLAQRFSIAGDQSYWLLAKSGLANLLMILLSSLVSGFSKRYRRTDTSLLLWIVLLSVPAFTLLVFSVFQYYVENFPQSGRITGYIYLSCLGLVFINITVFLLFGRLQKQMELRSERDMLTSQFNLQSDSINHMETMYNRTRTFRHDIKNHILVMNMLAEQGDLEALKSYLQDLSGVIDESDYVRISGISAVDAILNEKMYEAQARDITTSYDVIGLDKNSVAPLDLCIILSNALDNAIEANEKIEDKSLRYIRLKAHGNETFSVISVSNPVAEAPKTNAAGRFLTGKPDKEAHGYGLKSIETTAAKYNGETLAKAEDGVFTLVVRLDSAGNKQIGGDPV